MRELRGALALALPFDDLAPEPVPAPRKRKHLVVVPPPAPPAPPAPPVRAPMPQARALPVEKAKTSPAGGCHPSLPDAYTGPYTHDWVVAAQIQVDPGTARNADFRGSFRTKEAGLRVEALEVYCGGAHGCRRPYEDVQHQPCQAKIDNTHLIGGDQTVRAKRKLPHRPDGAVTVPADQLPRVNRTGLNGYARP